MPACRCGTRSSARWSGDGHTVVDAGTYDDYPYAAAAVARALADDAERAVLVCGSGAGVSVAATKLPGVRAATVHDGYTAHQGVEHDDLNVLCLGARVIGPELARRARARVRGRAASAARSATFAASDRSPRSSATASTGPPPEDPHPATGDRQP